MRTTAIDGVGTRRFRVGWSRTTVTVDQVGPILDLGSGAFPNPAADILCDGSLEDSRHRHGLAVVVDRPMVVARAEALPFRRDAFAYVIASHIAEHVDDPVSFCAEVGRVARAGYIETPSPLADRLLEEEYHLWRVTSREGRLTFTRKTADDRRPRRWSDVFYRIYNAGESCARPTADLPSGSLGRIVGVVLLVLRALLNRSGIMHTRHRFGSSTGLQYQMREPSIRKLTFISRPPRSGFVDADREALQAAFDVHEIEYRRAPGPRFSWSVIRAAWATDGLYGFFASEHMLVPAIIFRLARKPIAVSVGGYDIAADRKHGYGLAASASRRWLPKAVLWLSDVVIPFSGSAEAELAKVFPTMCRKSRTINLGIDTAVWGHPSVGPERQGVVTVAYVNSESWSRKGIDRFIELARSDPDRTYVLAGQVDPRLGKRLDQNPPNLRMTGYLSHWELRELLWSSAVYAQLSWHEGFGLSVLEAMACGVTPLVTDLPALVEVTGEWSVVVPAENRDDDLAGVRRAMAQAETVDPSSMSAWIDHHFSRDARRQSLTALLAELLDG